MRIHGATRLAIAMAACLVVPVTSGARTNDKAAHGKSASGPDQFIKDAAAGGMAEVKLGELAENNGHSNAVKSFGKRMRDDHSQANSELEQLATQKNVTLPKHVDAKEQATYDRLSKLKGAEFDRAYMNAMLEDHRHDVAEFQRATTSSDPDVQAFASKTLPTLQSHLDEAQQIASGSTGRGR
jgi:putative membrane protein